MRIDWRCRGSGSKSMVRIGAAAAIAIAIRTRHYGGECPGSREPLYFGGELFSE